MQAKKNKNTAVILGVAFVWFTTHFGGGFASGAQIYSYFVKYGIACLILPVLAMVYNGVFFAYSLRFARKHEVYDYRSYNNAFYGRFAPVFSNLFEVLYICVMCVAPAVAFATGGATLSALTGLPYLLCTFLIGIFIFAVAVFGTDLVRKVASILSICIIAGLLIVYIPNIASGMDGIAKAAGSMKSAELPLGSAVYSAFLYGTFQLSNIAVFVQHASSFEKPSDAEKSMGAGIVVNALMMVMVVLGLMTVSADPGMADASVPTLFMVQKGRGGFFHDSADLPADHPGGSVYCGKYGCGHGKKDLQRTEETSGNFPKAKDRKKRDRRGAYLLYRRFRHCPVRSSDSDPEGIQPDRLPCDTGHPDPLYCPYDRDQDGYEIPREETGSGHVRHPDASGWRSLPACRGEVTKIIFL